MTPGDKHQDKHHVADTFRMYQFTTIYICSAITVVLVLLVWDLIHGSTPPTCQ